MSAVGGPVRLWDAMAATPEGRTLAEWCLGKGGVVLSDAEFQAQTRRETARAIRQQEERIAQERAGLDGARFQAADFPHRYALATLRQPATDAQQAVFRALEKFRASAEGGEMAGAVFLHGIQGAGKTYAACAVLRSALRRGLGGLFVRESAWIARCFERQASALLAAIETAPVLVFDDLGRECWRDGGEPAPLAECKRDMLWQVVDARYLSMRPTIYTSLLPPDALATALGGPLAGRLLDGIDLDMGGESVRGVF